VQQGAAASSSSGSRHSCRPAPAKRIVWRVRPCLQYYCQGALPEPLPRQRRAASQQPGSGGRRRQ
jgi:hypothetical protein